MPVMTAVKAGKKESWNRARDKRRANGDTLFVAIDGEGHDINRKHEYFQLAVGDRQLHTKGPMQWWEAFDFIDECSNDYPAQGTVYVGFFLGYDFTQILSTIDESSAQGLLIKTDSRYIARQRHNDFGYNVPFPVISTAPDGTVWYFDMLPGNKRLKIKRKVCDCKNTACKHGKWISICDAGPFFQQSFLSVIDPESWDEPIVTDKEFAIISAGKEQRDGSDWKTTGYPEFDALTPAEKGDIYNLLENEILARVMGELNHGLHKLGVKLKKGQWFGPGQAAQAYLRTTAVPTRGALEEIAPRWGMQAGVNTYYGGWFELMMHGHVKEHSANRIVHEYDINSAYPATIAKLPCLLHGEWISGTNKPGKFLPNGYYAVHVTVTGNDPYIGPLPYRTEKGGVLRPQTVKGWYWQHEIDAALAAGLIKSARSIKYHEYRAYLACDCLPPLAAIAGLYKTRQDVGKDTPLGKACKLIYNSVYGKLCQSEGDPTYGNPIYASLITAGCRVKILEAIATHPLKSKGVAMVATDGIYFLTPHPTLPISGTLGEWSHGEKKNLTLFKPGVYWDDYSRQRIAEKKSPKFKSRGVPVKEFAKVISQIDEIFSSWDTFLLFLNTIPEMDITLGFSMVSLKQALIRRKWNTAGNVTHNIKVKQSADIKLKRETIYYDAEHDVYRSTPYETALGGIETHTYGQVFGWGKYDPEMHDPTMNRDEIEESRLVLGDSPDGPNDLIARGVLGV